MIPAPFDYARQGILYTPVHLARPGRGISEAALDEAGSKTLAYARASADRLPELLRGAVSPMSLLFPDA